MDLDQYRLVKQLGQGGQGSTIQIKRKTDGKDFAAKKLLCRSIQDANVALQEAKMLQSLHHPGIVRYEDFFLHQEKETGRPDTIIYVIIIMELCDCDMNCEIMRNMTSQSPFPEQTVVKWCAELFSALQYIHEQRILHRDVKSQNLFLTSRGGVRLGDFGHSKRVTDGMQSRVGTMCYLSPEVRLCPHFCGMFACARR
jgi:NIMA (never in mitosis gene a)-related kinase